MSISLDAVSLYIPVVPRTQLGAVDPAAPDQVTGGATAARHDGKSGPDAITPVPIQPLSNQMLATFMEKDIELYGSMVGG
jgi:hypothetical protein